MAAHTRNKHNAARAPLPQHYLSSSLHHEKSAHDVDIEQLPKGIGGDVNGIGLS